MTVDNALENVQACIRHARQSQQGEDSTSPYYVSTPQRLDQNTSGLLVVSTSKRFSAYFSKLLFEKTRDRLAGEHDASDEHTADKTNATGGIHKVYKCLVCLLPPNDYARNATMNLWESTPAPPPSQSSSSSLLTAETWSVGQAMQQLSSSVNQIVTHWLEPSHRAPKRYFTEAPPQPTKAENKQGARMWMESMLKITHVGTPCTLVGNTASETLARQLWSGGKAASDANVQDRIPHGCRAVVEVEVELLTGRTHQIRGQLAAMGYPLVGDAQYGGANPVENTNSSYRIFCPETDKKDLFGDSELLALQCSQLEFLDPDEGPLEIEDEANLDYRAVEARKRKRKHKEPKPPPLIESNRWNRFQLDRAWWTDFLEDYENDLVSEGDDAATTSLEDAGLTGGDTDPSNEDGGVPLSKEPRPDLLPNRVQLSPGKNKYVLVRAYLPPGTKAPENGDAHQNYWFVKSATPKECGGPYHGNVAQDLREWIEACGYEAHVTGGGRIDYDPNENRCVVYGFSYGFGKGNHKWAAKTIRDHTDIPATFDDSDNLY